MGVVGKQNSQKGRYGRRNYGIGNAVPERAHLGAGQIVKIFGGKLNASRSGIGHGIQKNVSVF